MTFASNQVRIRAPRDPARAWALTQALVAARRRAGAEARRPRSRALASRPSGGSVAGENR